MASAKKCDACGNFYPFVKDEENANGITLAYFNEVGQVSHTIDRKELCPDCLAKITAVIKKEV